MSVFGEILFLSNVSGTIVFVAVMIFLTIFEALLHSVEVECSKRGYKGLIKKLYREFMIMGFISFAILLGTESSTGFSTTNQWYQSFHLAHIVILFIGITFLCQAILLVSLISLRNKTLLSYGDSNPEKLALEYINIHHEGGVQRWFFDHGLITIPFPQLRERIEYKMLQEFFIHFYNLPREFKFANYMSQSLKDYIISLVEVRPITWIVLVALIAVNYLRVAAIDPYYQHDVCERYPAKNLNYGVGHRLLAGGGGGSSEAQYDDQHAYEVCNEYTLRYVFFCSMMIVFYLLGVFIASEVYIQRLIDKVLDVEESIEREEERLAAEDTPMFDIDDLHDRDSSVIDSVGGSEHHHHHQQHHQHQHQHPNSGSSRPSSFRRTGSHQSLDSLPPHPSTWDVENSGRSAGSAAGGAGQARGRSSVASQHRASLASQFFGGYFEDDHASVAGGVAGVAQALHGIVMGKNRRHLYLHCIQRMIQTEEEVTRKEARRMSIGSDDGGAHGHPSSHTSPTPSGLTSTAAPGGNRLSVHSAGSHHARARGISHAPAYISEIYDQHFRPNHPHPLHHSGGPQHHGADGHNAHDDRSPTPASQGTWTFRENNPLATLKPLATVNHPSPAAANLSSSARNRATSAVPTAVSSDTSSYGHSLRGLWDRTFAHGGAAGAAGAAAAAGHGHGHGHSRQGSDVADSPVPPPRAHGGGRARAYSAQYFQIEHTPGASSDGADGDGGGGGRAFDDGWWCCGLWPLLRGLFRLTRIVLLWCGRFLIDTLLGHHIGTPHADVQPDRDIQARVEVFRSIFLWQRPGLYYFAVEFSLLIQCFYIALWATNFVVIARDSYFPVLWEIALVVPLPINFFLLKQIIYTSCMVKAIVQMDQRTANRIIEQAIDERNVTQRLRRIVRDTMKTWEVPRKEWPGRLQAYFDLYADADHTMDKDSFKAFLHEIQIFITDDSLKNLFKVIDVDRDHRIAWSMLTKIIFPDAKKTKKIKLRKRPTDGGGRVAYEYVVSEEAKKELEQEKAHAERRGSMLGMLSRVSASTAEGAISAVRSNSLTRLSMLAMLGPQQAQQQQQPPGAADGGGGGVASRTHSESKLERLFPKLLPLSTPERAQQAKTLATDALMEDATAAADESTAAVSIVVPAASKPRGVTISDVTVDINAATSARHRATVAAEGEAEAEKGAEKGGAKKPKPPTAVEGRHGDSDDEEGADEGDDDDDDDDDVDDDEEDFDSTDSTSGDEDDDRPSDFNDVEDEALDEDFEAYQRRRLGSPSRDGNASPGPGTGTGSSGYTYGYGAAASSSTSAATSTISVPRSTGGLPLLAMPPARPTTPTTAPSTAATVNVRPPPPTTTTTTTATGDVISISSRMSNLRISARNLFDI